MHRTAKITVSVLLVAGVIASGLRYAALRATADSRFQGKASQRVFDPGRNASADLHLAQDQARLQHKNILVDVGGNWCPSCILLDRTLKEDANLQSLLTLNYILVHVNWSSDNRNNQALGAFPTPHGYPALYVTSPDGHLVRAENTEALEETTQQGTVYSRAALATFLTRYAPKT